MIEELRALLAKATPGRLQHGPLWWEVWSVNETGEMVKRVAEIPTVHHLLNHESRTRLPEEREQGEALAALIVAAVNALPALLDEIVSRGEALNAALIARASYVIQPLDAARTDSLDVERLLAIETAAQALVDRAETDDDFEGQFVDWIVEHAEMEALRTALDKEPKPRKCPADWLGAPGCICERDDLHD